MDENKNENTEIWRQKEEDYYSPSIHITKDGQVGVNVGGLVFVASIEDWHKSLSRTQSETYLAEALRSKFDYCRQEFNMTYVQAVGCLFMMAIELIDEANEKPTLEEWADHVD